jgi:RNA polymerase sigma-70 factor (ECF subfamily)
MDETALAAELRNGNPAVYERLYREQGSRMKSIAYNLLGSVNEAEDAVHDTFVKVFRAAASFDGRCPVNGWLFRILINHCNDRLRQRRPTVAATELPPAAELRAAPENPALRAALRGAIAQLAERQRSVFLLYEVEGFRHAEIAGMMETPEATVRQLLHSAKKNLRAILRPAEVRP